MHNRIDAALTTENRDKILEKLAEIKTFLPFLIDLSPEERQSFVKMGASGRPFVEQSLNLVEQNDGFMPRSFDKTEMRTDNDLYETLLPVFVQFTQLYEALNDTMLLVGSDLIMAGLEVYKNAKANGQGENLDNLVPLLGKRFKPRQKKDDKGGDGSGEEPKK